MVSLASCGIMLMALQGLALTLQMILAKLMQRLRLPYFRLTACTCALFGVMIMLVLACSRTQAIEPWKRKWIHLRGIFGALSFGGSALAVQAGVPMGDVAALTSINVVIAALLGRLFLREPLRFFHAVAVACSVVGATLISEPQFLFGTSEASETSWIGYTLAPAAGFFNACVFITCRRASGVSPMWFALSSMFWSALAFATIPLTPFMEDFSFGSLANSPPLSSLGWLAAVGLAMVGRSLMLSAGAKWCPAAVSATVSNASCLVFGYVAQVVLFDAIPKPLTAIGAVLMLASIVTMALAQGRDTNAARESSAGVTQLPIDPPCTDTAESDDDTESLASFVASEFSAYSTEGEQLRQRKMIRSTALSDARMIGVVATL